MNFIHINIEKPPGRANHIQYIKYILQSIRSH